ncbi:MAG: hypothetical protein JWR38_1225 [Mucilaginibacter sp.]|nr:hypothetical protein [Mucilaginibacter sp.]
MKYACEVPLWYSGNASAHFATKGLDFDKNVISIELGWQKRLGEREIFYIMQCLNYKSHKISPRSSFEMTFFFILFLQCLSQRTLKFLMAAAGPFQEPLAEYKLKKTA